MINMNTKDLLNAVKKAAKIKNISTLPICDTIELSITDKQMLKVYRFCLDIQYTEVIEHTVIKDLKQFKLFKTICVNALELQKVLAKEKQERIDLSVIDGRLHIQGKYAFTLDSLIDDSSMRHIESPSFDECTELGSEPLEYLKKAVSKDQTRFVLNGIYFDEDKGNVVATDGRRQHVFFIGDIAGSGIVPGELLKLIKGDCKVKFATANDRQKVFILNDGGIYSTNAIEGTYPNYMQVIPTSFSRKVKLNMAFIKDSLAMIKGNEDCSLHITSSTHSVLHGNMSMAVDLVNNALKEDTICFNRQYLVDAVNDGDIALDINDEYKPVRYQNGDYMAVIMPMRA